MSSGLSVVSLAAEGCSGAGHLPSLTLGGNAGTWCLVEDGIDFGLVFMVFRGI